RRIIVGRVAVKEPVGDNLVDDLLFEILRVGQADKSKERCRIGEDESESGRCHGKDLTARLATDCRGHLESETYIESYLPCFGAGLTAKSNLFHFAELRRTKWVER